MTLARRAAVLESILSLLLHRGGRWGAEPLGFCLGEADVDAEEVELALREGFARGFFLELGDDLILCRAGWGAIALSAAELPGGES